MQDHRDSIRRDGRCYAIGENFKTVCTYATGIERNWIYLTGIGWVRTNFFTDITRKKAYFMVAYYGNNYNLIDYIEL